MANKFNLRLILILTSLSIGVMSFFLPIYSKELNMNATEIGGLFSIVSFMLVIIRPFIGKLIDKVGRKPVLCGGILLQCISYLIFSKADNSLNLYIARAFQGLSAAFMGVSINVIIADTHNDNNISEGFGKVSSANATGNFYGCILAFVILSQFSFFKGWKILFLIFALTCFYAFIKAMMTYKENKSEIVNKKLSLRNYSKTTIKLLIIIFITGLFSSISSPILMIYLQDKVTDYLGYLALAFFPSIIIISFCSSMIGSLSDKFGKIKSMVIGGVISGLTFILIPSLNSIYMFAAIWTICTLGGLLYDLSESGLYAQLNIKNDNGEVFGIHSLVCNVASTFGPLIGGFLYDNLSKEVPFYFYGVGFIIVSLLIPILLKENN